VWFKRDPITPDLACLVTGRRDGAEKEIEINGKYGFKILLEERV
jgi:hypothetical protein